MLKRVSSEWAYLRGFLRALRATNSVSKNPKRTVRDLAEEAARRFADRPALISERETLTYRQWNGRANLYARWARTQGFAKGDVVALMMPNRPEYICIWLGFAKAGLVTALLNTNLSGASLARTIASVDCRAIVADARLLGTLESAHSALEVMPQIFVHGDDAAAHHYPRIDAALSSFAETDLTGDERIPLSIADPCLYIFTSGTTGLPKAANINHLRVQVAMRGFAAITGATAQDRIYNTLPMYHAMGGLCTPGAALTTGGACIIRESFSAHEFWSDIVGYRCTLFSYIGEMCRYLLAAPSSPYDRDHGVRLCCGNGLRPDIWAVFAARFALGRVIEFYAATEGNIMLVNFDSRPGAIGRIPAWMEHKFIVKLVRFDIVAQAPMRDAAGRCVECATGEVGEAIGRILDDPSHTTSRFEGYAESSANERKILRDVFTPGDAWFRSGDLMRRDAQGYFYFVDRIGDTFRWKGENVSTTEVAETIATFRGVREALVYGVEVAGTEGRAGMAALVVDDPADFRMDRFHAHLAAHLPDYARPLFLRFEPRLPTTGTFKPRRIELMTEGFDPDRIEQPVFFNDYRHQCFVPLDRSLHRQILAGERRL